MFRSKRNSLVKRLWKYRVNDETKSASQRDTSTTTPPQPASTTTFQEDIEFKSVTNSFFKRLKEDQLETLVQAMESRGGEVTSCVPVTKSYLRIGRFMVSPYVLCCRVFRWPDLKSDAEMKRLPSCMRQNEEKEAVICCNPYHWSLVVKIDEPPVQPQRHDDDSNKNEDGYPKILEPTDTGYRPCGHQDDSSGQSTECDCTLWCTVAYWELRERVGRLFSVTDPSVHIFQQLPHGDGICLRLFQKPTNVEVVKRTREKIGFGIILSREAAHRRDSNMLGTQDVLEESTGSPPGISVSPISAPLCLSSSPFLSPPQEDRGDAECGQKSHSVFSSTSDSQTPAMPSGERRADDGVDLVQSVISDIMTGCDEKDLGDHHYGDSTDQPPYHQHGHEHATNDSMHDSYLYVDSMDYMHDLGTSPPYFQQSHHLSLHPQSRSPSCLSSSSFSSSPPSSPPLYFSSDTSFNDLHYQSVNCGTLVDASAATHIINNSKANNTNSHHSNISTNNCIKRFSTGPSADNSKSGRLPVTPPIHGPSTVTQTTNMTSSSVLSSNLPANQGEVWAYNASDFPIFVNSPTLDDPQFPRSLVVKKVPPGYSIKIYDYARAQLLEQTDARSVLLKDGPFDPCSVRISLAKGWGPNYSRQFITSCPCWLEVLLGARKHSSAS